MASPKKSSESDSVSAVNTLTPKAAYAALKTAVALRRPILMTGPAGVGKSDMVRQLGRELNRPVYDIRLNLYDPTDIKGFPFKNERGQMEWAISSEFPSEPDSNAIVFLDELTSSAPMVQCAAYQYILDRRIGNHVVPAGVDIIAAGNGVNDRGLAYKVLAPLASRFINIEVKTNFTDFEEWGLSNDIHPDVLAYLKNNGGHLHKFDPKSVSRAFPCPRTWSFVSKILHFEDQNTLQFDGVDRDTNLRNIIYGTIGDGVGNNFLAWREVKKDLPDVMDVLEGKVEKCNISNISGKCILIYGLCFAIKRAYEANSPHRFEYFTNYINFLLEALEEPELSILGAKIIIRNFGIIPSKEVKSWETFTKKNGKMLTAAIR